jgi:hypothetical protein
MSVHRFEDAAFQARLWAKVLIGEPDECWPWIGATAGKDGCHGQIKVPGEQKNVYAHRVVYIIMVGPIPAGMEVRHSCDYGLCCNWRHLLVGTHADNMADAAERKRMPRSLGHWNGRLSNKQVVAIRGDRRTHIVIANAYGISRQHVGDIKSGRKRVHA